MTVHPSSIPSLSPVTPTALRPRVAGEEMALEWLDAETGERLRVSVTGSEALLQRLLEAGFLPAPAEIQGQTQTLGQTPRASLATRSTHLDSQGFGTGVPRTKSPQSDQSEGTPTSPLDDGAAA